MKKLFEAIRKGDADTVRRLISAKPGLIACTAPSAPKKDAGQSPLQVALKTGSFGIVDLLLDSGADVGFIEDPSCGSAWRAPVVHDAINCAVMCSRWNVNDRYMGFRVCSTKEEADEAFRVLGRIIDAGADVNALDSFGNSGLFRFALQAKQILPQYVSAEHRELDDRVFTPELHEDLRRILQALKDAGADEGYAAPNFGYSVRSFCSEGSIAVLFEEVFG